MTSSRAKWAAVAVIVGLASSASGCSRGSTATPAPSTAMPTPTGYPLTPPANTSTTTTSPTSPGGKATSNTNSNIPPKPRQPAYPATARKHTREGAIAFTKYYFDVLDYAYRTGNRQEYIRLGLLGCTFCEKMEGDVARVTKDGGRFLDRIIEVAPHGTKFIPIRRGVFIVYVTSRICKARFLLADGTTEVNTSQEGPGDRISVYVEWVDGDWCLYEAARGYVS